MCEFITETNLDPGPKPGGFYRMSAVLLLIQVQSAFHVSRPGTIEQSLRGQLSLPRDSTFRVRI